MSNSEKILSDLNQESYRDSVATITKEGTRNFIIPKKPYGRFYNRRTLVSILYLIIFFSLPFIKINGEPLLMLNVLDRKFIIFGLIFWPQDFFIFGIAMITFVVFIILFTVVFGRIFCGWICPQTIFMEMVFRKIEYWIDGDASRQRKLKEMPWNGEKITKRVIKFILFYGLSFIIANFFLAYMISMDSLTGYIRDPAGHRGTLITLLGFTTVFFFVYWWFREQACIVVCPYGRLQGVLLDKNSIVVAYDHKRGEPRGKLNDSNTGDCIDCAACVRVCPTGIDIRNGTQLECVNCTACIDACDAIMDGIKKPRGLVRYASENSIAEGIKLSFTARIRAYTIVLTILMAALIFFLVSRSDLDSRLMRTAGLSYTSLPDGRISNLFNLKLANKTHKDISFKLKIENMEGEIQVIGANTTMVVKQEDYTNLQFFLILKRDELKGYKTEVKIGMYENDKKLKTLTAKFIGPEVYN